MSKLTATVLGLALLPATTIAVAGQPKVDVCHNGHTINIAAPAVQAHLGHGDYTGSCASESIVQERIHTTVIESEPVVRERVHTTVINSEPVRNVEHIIYHYLYYPDAEVYFDTDRTLYFYRDNGRWVSNERLPQSYMTQLGQFITLDREDQTPANFHVDTPSWLRGNEEVSRYMYYPEAQVYFDPNRSLYFYQMDNRWIAAPTLMDNLRGLLNRFVEIDMRTSRPYDYQQDIVSAYGNYDSAEPFAEPLPNQRSYYYRYYPEAGDGGVYYDEVRNMYFYQDNNQWVSTPTLQDTLLNTLGTFISMTLNTPDPYERQQDILSAYRAGAIIPQQTTYQYQYYPEQDVYYDTGRQVYYYQSQNNWETTTTRPRDLATDAVGLLLNLATDQPYRYHREIVREYPTATTQTRLQTVVVPTIQKTRVQTQTVVVPSAVETVTIKPKATSVIVKPATVHVEVKVDEDTHKSKSKTKVTYTEEYHEKSKSKEKHHNKEEHHGKGKGKDH